jgi:hypothetical protein
MQRALFLASVLLVCVGALPSIHRIQQNLYTFPKEDDAPPGDRCAETTATECMKDDCCNWCGLHSNTSQGFCMPMIPKPIPSLVCTREPPTCAELDSQSACGQSTQCKWIPKGIPSMGKGTCIYDWDRCNAPPPSNELPVKMNFVFKFEAKAEVSRPKFHCNMTRAKECNDHPCCHWCSSKNQQGFCMPMIDKTPQKLSCAKEDGTCDHYHDSDSCEHRQMCSWHGKGKCKFDDDKCMHI